MNFRRLLILSGCLALALALAACDDDDNVSCPAGGQPLLSDITASQMMVDAGDTVQLSVEASGHNLSYLWTAEAGTILDPTSLSTAWVAPGTPGVYAVTITANGDNNLTASRTLALGVEMMLQVVALEDQVVIAHDATVVARAVGQNLEYLWTVTGGSIAGQAAPDTITWKAPDQVPLEAPLVKVTIVDQQGNSRSESVAMTVLPYTPTDHPYYVGVSRCADCHSNLADLWATSAHAGAAETLEEAGQAGNAYCMGCHTVGTHGYEADPAADNRAWNDVPLESLEEVQCENCHGPGSAHADREVARLDAPLGAAVCGDCHNGPHHPTYEEWQTSGHGQIAEELTYPAGRTSCSKCHNGYESWEYLSDPANWTEPASLPGVENITCAVCHNPHGSDAPGQLRAAAVTDVVLPNGRVIPQAGAGRLCMTCHNGRRGPVDIEEMITDGSEHFGPHHSVQGDMLAGTGAYEEIAPSYPFGTSTHLKIKDGCVHCHTLAEPFDEVTGVAYTGHTFQPTLNACNECHGQLTSFDDVTASQDYDGDGGIEGVQDEITELMTMLEAAIVEASDTPAHRQQLLDALAADDFVAAVGDTNITTRLQREAGYNLFFVEFDQSRGIHNARYAAQLLQQSILALTPGKVSFPEP